MSRQVWTVLPDGSGATELVSLRGLNASGLAWSPDGASLAVSGLDGRIYFVNAAGTVRRLAVAGRLGVVDWGRGDVAAAGCVVPKLVGKASRFAKASIRKAGCSLGKLTTKVAGASRRGRVIAQKPRPKTLVSKGTKVALTVGR